MAGYTSSGFVSKTLEEIVSELETSQRADVDSDLTFGAEEPLTQLNGIFSEQIAQLWELAEMLAAIDPNSASGFRVDQIALITGTVRDPASPSTVNLNCSFSSGGVTLLDGIAKVGHATNPDIVFVADGDFTSSAVGTESVPFRATVNGPTQAASGTLTDLVVPVAGWTAATNPLDATPGTLEETDSELKEKRTTELASGGGASFPTLLSALSRVPGVTSVNLLNNRSHITDGNGLPPHSVEAIIVGGTDEDIAQALFDNASAGTGYNGTTSVSVADSAGNSHTIRFTRPTIVDVWLEIAFTHDATYIGEAAHKLLIAGQDSQFNPGDDVYQFRVLCDATLGVQGIINPQSALIGDTASVVAADLDINPREIADFDTTRITLVPTLV